MKNIFLCLVVFYSCSALAKEIRIGGGAAPINNIFRRVLTAYEKSSGNKLILSEDGPDQALMDLDNGKLDIAAAGLPYTDWLKLVEKKGYKLKDPNKFKYRVIGRDLIQIYVSPDVAVTELSKDQLRDIFTGRVTNWKAVGGSDAPITVVFGEKIPGTNKVFEKEIFPGSKWAPNLKSTTTAPEIAKTIADTKGAIGLGPIGLDSKDTPIRTIKGPTVGRPIIAATSGAPSDQVLSLFDFILREGKDLTKE